MLAARASGNLGLNTHVTFSGHYHERIRTFLVEWECCVKHPEDGAREAVGFVERHVVRTTADVAFDAFLRPQSDAEAQLHHAVIEQHLALGLLTYFFAFAAIWWAWMGFTWFANAYDADDATYRL